MKKLVKLLVLFCFLSLFFKAKSQDTSYFLLLGGQEFSGIILSEDDEVLHVKIRTKKGKEKTLILWKDRLFSVTTSGKEVVWYEVDTTDEYQYSEEEMREYIYGQQDARKNYKVTLPILVGGGVSALASFWAGTHKSALVLTGPLAGTLAGTASKNNKPKKEDARNEKILASAAYIEGYRKGARSKKVIRTIGSSIVGMVVGGSLGFMVADSNP